MSYLVQYFGMRRNKRGKILIGYHEGGNGSNKVKNHCYIRMLRLILLFTTRLDSMLLGILIQTTI